MNAINSSVILQILELYPKLGAAETAKRMHLDYERCKLVIVESGKWVEPYNAPRLITKQLRAVKYVDYKETLKLLPKSELTNFIKDYLKSYGDGTLIKLSKKYNCSIPTIQRLRVKLKLPELHSAEHPGRRKMLKRLKRLFYSGRSSIQVGEIVRMSSENVRKLLISERVTMNPAHCVDPKYFKTKSHLTPTKLLAEIKRLYLEEQMPLVKIAKEVGVWEGTVSSKLKAMGLDIITRRSTPNGITLKPNLDIIGIYKGVEPYRLWCWSGVSYSLGHREPKGEKRKCIWCSADFTAGISRGPRSQKFCNPKCKNKAKDLRRGLKARFQKGKMRPASKGRFTNLALEFTGSIDKLNLPEDVKEEVVRIRRKTNFL